MSNFIVPCVFLSIFSVVFALLWYWVAFKNGAEHWQKEILKIHGEKYRTIAHPIVAKMTSTILLLVFLFALILLLMSKK